MKRSSVCIAVGLLVAGCAGQAVRPPTTEVTRIPEQGGWFCQLGRSGQGWECVQDPQLAKDPVPDRLPTSPAEPPAPSPEPAPVPLEPDGATEPPIPEPQPQPTPEPQPPIEPPAPEPQSLMQLPRDFYAVQMLAMTSREELDDFTARHDLAGLQAARVERDGTLYYVLLLGVYPSLEQARDALADLPRGLSGVEPWIRPVGSLQAAMARADALVSSAGI